MPFLSIIVFSFCMAAMGAFPDGPNQQCHDDAGPPWTDDGPVAYYVGFPNAPLLPSSGECPAPLSAACAEKGALPAHLDGPVDCGGKGWFCRIFDQPDHRMPGVRGGSFPDSNFASCNQSETEHDLDGHCHGSDVDDTYGWWIRDHWHRNYAGRLKCCCDWQATVGIVNRCDYRKHVTPAALPNCRDANEEHNVDWGPGCNQSHFQNYKEPAAETCWEVTSFGPGPFEEPPQVPVPTPSPSQGPTQPVPTPLPTPPPAPSTGGPCPDSHIKSQATGVCLRKPWDDFAGCAEEAKIGLCEGADEWSKKHCCMTCGFCSRPTTPMPSLWMPVDGGVDRACRGRSATDNFPTYYLLHTRVFSIAACKTRCEETVGCKGIEHKPSGRCEVWLRPRGIQASKAVPGFTCLRFESNLPPALPPVQGFEPVSGGSDRACRGENSNDNIATYYTVHAGVVSIEDCKVLCVATQGCQGIEYSQNFSRCEVWTRAEGIQAYRQITGFACYRYKALVATAWRSRPAIGSRRQAFLGTALLQQRIKSRAGARTLPSADLEL